ncbi:PDR/VanB family oxidoreductase [Streptomyces ochraceiscleroticus]|uniref:PDR/VanB family oxidoreductase n=1 Tax=Streptomyces ochraceiscleroticus TaxID=47761 RepID=A0ABW1MKW7_9ACTN|nr:PDR/VanB family oxidoreductase [Streptomyces ochraceiscleroticus]
MNGNHEEAELDLVVTRRTAEADSVISLELRDPNGADLPDWTPGAHLDLMLAPNLVRQYSLCSDPADRSMWRVAVLREPDSRGGSRRIHDELREESTVRVRGPRNHFTLAKAERYVFIAGGIGITPIVPMVAAAEAAGAEWTLGYGGRSRATMAFSGHLTAAYGERVALRPQDEYGILDLGTLLGAPDKDTLVYCCGPEPLLKAIDQHCAAWPTGALHVERFAPKEHNAPVLDKPFEVELAQTGVTVTVPPQKTILQAVEEAGVHVLSSCQEGTCGTCETPVLAGEVDHRDSLLTAGEQAAMDTMMICVSRAACPRLVLDL